MKNLQHRPEKKKMIWDLKKKGSYSALYSSSHFYTFIAQIYSSIFNTSRDFSLYTMHTQQNTGPALFLIFCWKSECYNRHSLWPVLTLCVRCYQSMCMGKCMLLTWLDDCMIFRHMQQDNMVPSFVHLLHVIWNEYTILAMLVQSIN